MKPEIFRPDRSINRFRADTAFQWPLVEMSEVVTLNYGKALKEDVRRPGAVPVYGTNGRTGWHDTSLGHGPTVILGRKGMGNLGVEWCEGPFWVIDTAYYTSFREDVLPRFFYYFTNYVGLNHLKDGTSNPSLSRDTFSRQWFPLPPIDEQKRIAAFLSALDDKIELNNRMNETLETMARAIFKDWFVDFGPTRAKAEGRPPYLAPDVWALFPGILDEVDKPVGWLRKPLDEIAAFLNGLALQKYPPEGNASLPVIKIAELRQGVTARTDRASTEIPIAYVVEDGDILFSWSGSLTHLVWSGGKGALNQHLFKVTSDTVPKWFLFHWIGQLLPAFQAIAASKATTMGHIQRHHLSEATICVPDDKILAVADQTIGPLFNRQLANELENRTLAQLRDLLLPKLMSGEIRSKNTDHKIEEAL